MDDHLSRLGKIEGQIRGLQKMVEADSWCPDVVIQLTSAICGSQEVAAGLLNDRLAHCVASDVRRSDAEGEAALAEVAATIPLPPRGMLSGDREPGNQQGGTGKLLRGP